MNEKNNINIEDLNVTNIEKKAFLLLEKVSSEKELEDIRRDFLGPKGIIKKLFKKIGSLEKVERIEIAKKLNEFKSRIEERFFLKKAKLEAIKEKGQLATEFIDFSLPEKNPGLGKPHPIRLIERKITSILKPFGFKVVEGPEIESEYYCFDALNIPKHHPARDLQDTFYTEIGGILRTHTTSIQTRELEKRKLPLKVIACGRTYRNEADDASHQSMFHQYELVWVEKGLTLSHLMALIVHILQGIYGNTRKVRFVPKYYPYTEPSIGPQIDCIICKRKGCPACKGSGWVTTGGAGMIHENVFKEFKYDPKMVSGLAFGLGTSRLASQFFHAPNLKTLYTNDLRFLRSVL